MRLRYRASSEKAAAMVEYALVAALLVAAFLLVSDALMAATNYRIHANAAAVKGFTPCVDKDDPTYHFKDGLLTGDECK